jgi:hypothetical protein
VRAFEGSRLARADSADSNNAPQARLTFLNADTFDLSSDESAKQGQNLSPQPGYTCMP